MHVTYTYLLRGQPRPLARPPISLESAFRFILLVSFHFLGLLSSFLRDAFFSLLRPASGAILMGIYNFSPKSELLLLHLPSHHPPCHVFPVRPLAKSSSLPRFLHKMKLYCIFSIFFLLLCLHVFVFAALWLDTELLLQQ